jgi:hypothetical protein
MYKVLGCGSIKGTLLILCRIFEDALRLRFTIVFKQKS